MLSIIIPTFNEEKYLPQLLASIKRQTLPCETIVADANSSDQTLEIAKRFGCKIALGGNQARGRNQGAIAASGDILLFIDADTILPDNFLSQTIDQFQKGGLDLATCNAHPLSRHPFDLLIYQLANLIIFVFQKLRPFAQGFCIFAKKSLHQQIGGFDEGITFGEDSEYVLRAAKAGRFGVLAAEILVSSRRFEKEGHLKLLFKYLALNLRRMLRGEIREPIDYKYGNFSG